MQSLKLESSRLLTIVVGGALLLALALALVPGRPVLVSLALAVIGGVVLLASQLPAGWRLLKQHRALALVALFAALIVAWVAIGLHIASNAKVWNWDQTQLRDGQLSSGLLGAEENLPSWWPWKVGQFPVIGSLLLIVGAGGAFVLIADAVRVYLGLARSPRSSWRLLTAIPSRGGRVAARAIPGLALIAVVMAIGVGAVDSHFGPGTLGRLLGTAAIVICAAGLVAAPIAVGFLLRFDFDKEGHARELERQRVSAHLHDSVLQTLALIQRQADDPVAVSRLARRQEHALRAWMAGDVDLSKATLAGSLRDTVEEAQEDEDLRIELTVIGDLELDRRGEELIAAMREALRNVARHVPDRSVNVFLDVARDQIELFVRDNGPGFVFEDVPPERRGLRDAIVGRMQSIGGSAKIDSAPGEGTEIALVLPARRADRRGGER